MPRDCLFFEERVGFGHTRCVPAKSKKKRKEARASFRILNKPVVSYRRCSVSWTRMGGGRPACTTGVLRNSPGRGTEKGQQVSRPNPAPLRTLLPSTASRGTLGCGSHVILINTPPLCWRWLLNPGVAGRDRVQVEPSPAQPYMGRLGIRTLPDLRFWGCHVGPTRITVQLRVRYHWLVGCHLAARPFHLDIGPKVQL